MSFLARSDPPSVVQPKTSAIDQTALIAYIWASTGVCILFVITRLSINFRFGRRLYWDDAFAVLALCCLIANSVVSMLMAPPMYDILKLSAGTLKPGPNFMSASTLYLKAQFAATVLFWSCLWAVKGTFLAFFWRLTYQLKWPRRMWWAVSAITILAYIGSVITYPVSCTSFVLGECETPRHVRLSLLSLRFSTAVDMVTDFFIILIPLWLTIGLQLSIPQKLGLAGVLCLGVVTMVFAAIRIVVTDERDVHPEISWLALWSAIESSVAVCVACLTSFRVLFTQIKKGTSGRGRSYTPTGPRRYAYGSNKSHEKAKRGSKIGVRSHTYEVGTDTLDVPLDKLGHRSEVMVSAAEQKRPASSASERDWPDTASQEHILPSDGIRVQTTWRIARGQ